MKHGLTISLWAAMLTGCGGTAISAGFAQGDTLSYDVTQCIRYAAENNPVLRASGLEQERAGQLVREAQSAGLPQVSLNATVEDYFKLPASVLPGEFAGGAPGTLSAIRFGTRHNANGYLRADQVLYDGAFWIGLRAARKNLAYYQEKNRGQREAVVYAVATTYYRSLLAEEQRQITEANLRSATELLRVTELQYGSGLVEGLERDRIRVNFDNLLSDLGNAERDALQALNELKFQMGMPTETRLRLARLDTTLTAIARGIDTTASPYYTRRIDFRLLQLNGELLALDLKRVRAGYQPYLGAYFTARAQALRNSLNYLDTDQPWYSSYVVGLNLSFSVFDGLRKRAQAQQRRLSVRENEAYKNRLVQRVGVEVANARLRFSSRLQTLERQQRTTRLAGQVHQRVRARYGEGTGSYNDVVEAEVALYRAQGNYVTSLLDVYLAKLDLLKAQGGLLDTYW